MVMHHQGGLFDTWRTNNRVATYLIEAIPKAIWDASGFGPRARSIRKIFAHMHTRN